MTSRSRWTGRHDFAGDSCGHPRCREANGWQCAECGHYFDRSQLKEGPDTEVRCAAGKGHESPAALAAYQAAKEKALSAKWIVHITAADGTPSAAGTFPNRAAAERWAADLELATEGGLAGNPLELENPDRVLSDVAAGESR